MNDYSIVRRWSFDEDRVRFAVDAGNYANAMVADVADDYCAVIVVAAVDDDDGVGVIRRLRRLRADDQYRPSDDVDDAANDPEFAGSTASHVNLMLHLRF